MGSDEVDPTMVPLVVVDSHGRRRVGGASGDGEVIDLAPADPDLGDLADLAAAAVAIGFQAARLAAIPVRLTGTVLRRASRGTIGRSLVRGMQAMVDTSAVEGRREMSSAAQKVETQLGRILDTVIPVVVESVDVELVLDQFDLNEVMERVDLDRLLAQVDVGGLVDRIDVDAVIDRIDVNALLDRIEVDALLDRIDVNRLLDRIDVNALLDRADIDSLLKRADIDALLERVDIDALVDRIDMDALMVRTHIEEIVARGTSQVADSAIDLGRRQAVGLDALTMRIIDRVLGRDPAQMPDGPAALTSEPAPGDVPGDGETP